MHVYESELLLIPWYSITGSVSTQNASINILTRTEKTGLHENYSVRNLENEYQEARDICCLLSKLF
jgi:hypothetical protein